MTVQDFLKSYPETEISDDFEVALEKLYQSNIDTDALKVLSINKNGMFIDGENFLRVLSQKEVLNATNDLQVDFLKINIIPIIDSGDNDFICYDLGLNKWYKFNIVDQIKFKERNSINDYLSL